MTGKKMFLQIFQENIFLTNASTTMWGGSIAEGVNVCLDLFQIYRIKEEESNTFSGVVLLIASRGRQII